MHCKKCDNTGFIAKFAHRDGGICYSCSAYARKAAEKARQQRIDEAPIWGANQFKATSRAAWPGHKPKKERTMRIGLPNSWGAKHSFLDNAVAAAKRELSGFPFRFRPIYAMLVWFSL